MVKVKVTKELPWYGNLGEMILRDLVLGRVRSSQTNDDLILQMISAVGYLHKNSVYHGSLSLESFKFRANMEMYLDLEQSKIIDSSFSQVEPDEANYHIKNYEYYSSPEVLEAISNTEFGGTFDAYKSDVWALAILM